MAKRSAILVCQPGPVDRQRSMTSGGRRRLISCLGFCDLGRPPLLTTARLSMSSVSSGSSLYSWGLTTCEATLVRSEPKVRGEAGLLTVIGLSHAEDVSDSATGRVAHNDQASTPEAWCRPESPVPQRGCHIMLKKNTTLRWPGGIGLLLECSCERGYTA